MRLTRIMLAIPLAFFAAALLCRMWLMNAPQAIAADLAQPLAVVTYWHTFGSFMWFALFLGVAFAAIAYALVLRSLLTRDTHRSASTIAGVCAASILAVAACLAFPVIFSSDVYAYAAYGAMSLHGLDPYARTVLSVRDPIFSAAVWQWSNPLPLCVYGPVFVVLAREVLVAFAHFGVAGQLLGLRILAGLGLVACAPLAYAATRGLPQPQRLAAAAGIALNPIAIWSAAEGHNDALMLAVVLAGFIVARNGRLAVGACVIAMSSLIKAPGVAAAAALALYSWHDRRAFARAALGATAGIMLTAVVSLPFAWGVRNVLIPHGHYTPQYSFQWLCSIMLQMAMPHRPHAFDLGVALGLLAAGSLALYGVRLVLRREREGALFMALGLWLAIPNPYPWYALWILPVAFVALGTRASWAILIASLMMVFRYLPEATTARDLDTNVAITLLTVALPFAVLALRPAFVRATVSSEAEA